MLWKLEYSVYEIAKSNERALWWQILAHLQKQKKAAINEDYKI